MRKLALLLTAAVLLCAAASALLTEPEAAGPWSGEARALRQTPADAPATLATDNGADAAPASSDARVPGANELAISDSAERPRLRGVVVDEQGRRLAGVAVLPVFAGNEALTLRAGWRTNERGRFDHAAPAGAGGYVLRVSQQGLAGRTVPVQTSAETTIVLEGGGALSGRLRDARGRPLAGRLHVLAGDWEGTTTVGDDGRFHVDDLPAGPAMVRAEAPGHVPALGDAHVERGATASLDLLLEPGQTLRLRARRSSGTPAANARVLLRALDAEQPARARTNATGEASLAGVAPGEALLTVQGEGESAGPLSVFVPRGADPEPLELTLRANPMVAGVLRDPLGAPIPGGQVRAAPAFFPAAHAERRSPSERSARGDAEGRFALGALPVGETALFVEAPGFAPAELAYVVTHDAPPLELVLEPAAALAGVVLARDGSPAAGALVQANGAAATETDPAGRFAFDALPTGPVRLVATAEGAAPARAELELIAGERSEVRLQLAAGRTLRGTVRDDRGGPLRAAIVLDDPDLNLEVHTDEEGRFALSGVPQGPCRVFVSAPSCVPATVEAPAEGELTVTLVPERVVSGEVFDPEGHPAAVFAVAPADAPEQVSWFRGGRFTLVLGPLTSELLVLPAPQGHHHGPNEEPTAAPTRVPVPTAGGTLRVTLALGAEAEGQVVDAQGKPIPGAAFVLGHVREEDLLAPDALAPLGMSEEEGVFHVAGLPADGLDVTVSHPEHGPLHTRLTPGEDLRVQLPAEGRISGVARDADGQPLAGVPLVLDGPSTRRTTSGADGRFLFRGLASGDYTLTRVDTETATQVSVRAGTESQAELAP